MSSARITTSHRTIKQWAEARGGRPAEVIGTGDGSAGILRIEFADSSEQNRLDEIEWSAFFKKLDDEQLGLLIQNQTDNGELSRFCRIVHAPMGVLARLRNEHKQIKEVLADLSRTEIDNEARSDLLKRLERVLEPHMKAEEKVIYKELKKTSRNDEELTSALEGYEEHKLTRNELKRLRKAEPGSPKFQSRFKVLKELIEHHIEEEENELFDHALQQLGETKLEELSDAYTRREKKTLKKL